MDRKDLVKEFAKGFCEKEFILDYGLYPGWGFVCYKKDLGQIQCPLLL